MAEEPRLAHAEALNKIRDPENKQFLILQRKKGRPEKIANIDKKFTKRVADIKKRNDNIKKRQMKEDERIKSLTVQSHLQCEDPLIPKTPPQKRGRKKLLDCNLAVTLDISQLSDQKDAVVLTNTITMLFVVICCLDYNVKPHPFAVNV